MLIPESYCMILHGIQVYELVSQNWPIKCETQPHSVHVPNLLLVTCLDLLESNATNLHASFAREGTQLLLIVRVEPITIDLSRCKNCEY